MLNPLKQISLLSSFVFLLLFYCISSALAGDYKNSAHGNTVYGVNRSSISSLGYARGNCAHCHEQHASIQGEEPEPASGTSSNYLVFADTTPTSQTDNFCFNCHKSFGTLYQNLPENYNYSTTFGGQSTGSANTTDSIYDAFNPSEGSAHDLNSISALLQLDFSYPSTANPCTGCHNPHIARKNNATGGSYNPANAAISLPSAPGNLFGDEDTERMDDNPGTYRAPFYSGADPSQSSTLHEPDGLPGDRNDANVKGANTPNYTTFCLDCHSGPIVAASIPAIPWASGSTAKHGEVDGAGTPQGDRLAPYTIDGTDGSFSSPASNGAEDTTTNFILSCLDCHEPHGSQMANGEYLLRTTVNGVSGITIAGPGQWYNFCLACHSINTAAGVHASATPTTDCMGSGSGCHGHDVSASRKF